MAPYMGTPRQLFSTSRRGGSAYETGVCVYNGLITAGCYEVKAFLRLYFADTICCMLKSTNELAVVQALQCLDLMFHKMLSYFRVQEVTTEAAETAAGSVEGSTIITRTPAKLTILVYNRMGDDGVASLLALCSSDLEEVAKLATFIRDEYFHGGRCEQK